MHCQNSIFSSFLSGSQCEIFVSLSELQNVSCKTPHHAFLHPLKLYFVYFVTAKL
jgi:hypothetical protein